MKYTLKFCIIYFYPENDQYGTWSLTFLNALKKESGQIKAVVSNTLGHAMTSCQLSIVNEGEKKKEEAKAKKSSTQKAQKVISKEIAKEQV